jgi:hypothetical protein
LREEMGIVRDVAEGRGLMVSRHASRTAAQHGAAGRSAHHSRCRRRRGQAGWEAGSGATGYLLTLIPLLCALKQLGGLAPAPLFLCASSTGLCAAGLPPLN